MFHRKEATLGVTLADEGHNKVASFLSKATSYKMQCSKQFASEQGCGKGVKGAFSLPLSTVHSVQYVYEDNWKSFHILTCPPRGNTVLFLAFDQGYFAQIVMSVKK